MSPSDILILGGGPAGLVAAIGLARRGWAVTALTIPGRDRVEGLSPRVAEGLRIAGCRSASAILQQPVPRQAVWNGHALSVNTEYVVRRRKLDAALAADARDAGARVLAERIRSLTRIDGGWAVTTIAPDRRGRAHRGRFVIEARGRAAPQLGLAQFRGPETLALTGTFRIRESGAPFTGVASSPSGWAWCAREERCANVTLLLNGGRGAVPHRADLTPFYRTRLTGLAEADRWLAGASELERLDVRPATPRLVYPAVGDDWLRLGDAAFTIDPLSGHGIYEAIRAALTVPALVNTLLNRPQDSALAQAFHRDRAAEAFRRHARAGRDFYAMETRWPHAPFWSARRAWCGRGAPHPAVPQRAEMALRPVVDDDWIVEREVLVTPDRPLGVWRMGEVSIGRWLADRGLTLGHEARDRRSAPGPGAV